MDERKESVHLAAGGVSAIKPEGLVHLAAPSGQVASPASRGEAAGAGHRAPTQPEAPSQARALHAVPMKLAEAIEFVRNFHRHSLPPVSGLFAVGASDGQRLVGVGIVSRPVARSMDDGETAEVTRCCVVDDAPKGACSFIYARCWQAAKALGWRRLITYTLQSESGASLRGAGWKIVAQLRARDPSGWQSRPGREWQEVIGQAKLRWEAA